MNKIQISKLQKQAHYLVSVLKFKNWDLEIV